MGGHSRPLRCGSERKKQNASYIINFITKATKILLVQTLVFPIFLYAAETWTLREVEKTKIDALETWCWRRTLGVSWNEFRTNISIIRELDIKQRLSTLVHSRILKFFRHVSRRHSNSIERLVQGKLEGTRARGRSPMRWTDQIKSSVGGPLHECTTICKQKWRMIVRRVTTATNNVPP
ncbi:jg20181 [Pararge aegeria aegeria]|uniref:Jg20181 protein n=1 Tax=Pararge aegeria aegeria TaxID=348720 RepID=A0A8S4RYK4_9NEOP|nr:jg20181 [Pararge aegeria aegeria]